MNLYEELELSNLCTEDDIKKQYRRLASIHHPDKGGDEEKFKRLKLAYEILINPLTRKHYDQYGDVHQNNVERSEAIEQLLHMIGFIVTDHDPLTSDILLILNMEIKRQTLLFNNNINIASTTLTKLHTVKEKLIFNGESDDVLKSLIENIIINKNKDIETFKHRITICEVMTSIMKDYSYGFLAIANNQQ